MNSRGLECPTCFEAFSHEIYLCQTGHSICGNCCKKISVCPLCRKLMSSSRNYALETLCEKKPSTNIVPKSSRSNNCPICNVVQLSTKQTTQLLAHLESYHKSKFVTCSRCFTYNELFKKGGLEVEGDFLIVKWNDIIFKFSVKINHKAESVCFAMQIFDERKNNDYLFEVDYQRVARRDKFVGKVVHLTSDKKAFSAGHVAIPKQEFLQAPSNSLHVKVYCHFREDTSIPYFRKQRSALVTNTKK